MEREPSSVVQAARAIVGGLRTSASTFAAMLSFAGFEVGRLVNVDGLNPLHSACSQGNMRMVEVLLHEAGVSVHSKSESGKTAIYYAIKYAPLVKMLLQHGASVPRFSLHETARCGLADVTKVLIEGAEVDVMEQNCDLKTPARFTCTGVDDAKQKAQTLKILVDAGADPLELHEGMSLMHDAANYGLTECITLLVKDYGLDVDMLCDMTGGTRGYTALMRACRKGRTASMRELMRLGADLELESSVGLTALGHAVMRGKHLNASILIKAGASLAGKGHNKLTPLHVAAACGQMKCAYVLVEGGADVGARSAEGHTPLMLALKPALLRGIDSKNRGMKVDRSKVARLLLDMGAEVDSQVLQLAAQAGMNEVITETMKQLQRMHASTKDDLVMIAVRHSEEVVRVRLMNRVTKVDTGAVYKLNTHLMQQLSRVKGGSHGGESIIPRLLDPAKFGFKDGVAGGEEEQGGEGGGAAASSSTSSSTGKEVTLEYDNTDFTRIGFAAAVEFLTTGRLDRFLVNKKRKRSRDDDGEVLRTGLFDINGASRALQAARYFCLEAMKVEVNRLMELYGFDYEEE